MSRRAWVVSAAFILVAGTAWYVTRSAEAVPPPALGSTSEAVGFLGQTIELSESADPAAGDVGDEPAKRTEVSTEEAGWVVRGQVRRGIEDPFPGARLKAELFEGYDRSGEPEITAEIQAGSDGRFEWVLEVPDGTVSLRFSSGDAEVRVIPETRLVVAQQAPPQDILAYAFPIDARIEGQVTNASGEPLQASLVQSWSTSQDKTECDEDGRFSMSVSSWSSTILLRAAAPGYAMTRKNIVPPRSGETVVVDLELGAALAISGRVTDKEGKPVEGAQVATFFTMRYKSVQTDENGRYTIDYLEPGRSRHSLWARKEGYVEANSWVRTDDLPESCDLVLDSGLRCEGRVVGPNGNPILGARLYIGFDPSAHDRLDAVAREDGTFVFPHVGRGEQDLVTKAFGFATDVRKLEIPENSQLPINIEVRLELGKTLSGIVMDVLATPLSDIRVSARTPSASPRGRGRYIGDSVTTNAEGWFKIVDLPPGKIDLEFFARGYIRHTERGSETGREDLRIEMKRSAKLAGKVVDGSTGKPLDRFRIRFTHPGSGGMAATWVREGHEFQDSKGLWDTGNTNLVSNEKFVIEASAEGYGLASIELEAEKEPDPDQHVLHLYPSESITGRVLAASTGEPIGGARIVLFTKQNPIRPGNSEDFHGRIVATTDADGRFEMSDVPIGEVSLAVQHPDWPMVTDGPFSVSPGVPVDRPILVQSLGRLAGTVVDVDGLALAGAIVRVLAQNVAVRPRGELRTKTDSQGKFELERGLEPGIYVVFIENSEGQSPFTVISGMVEIALGETSDVSLQPAGTGEIIAKIESDEAELPESFHLMIRLLPGDVPESIGLDLKVFYSMSVGREIHVKGLPPGRYMVFASEGQVMGSGEAQVDESTPARVTVKVQSMNRRR